MEEDVKAGLPMVPLNPTRQEVEELEFTINRENWKAWLIFQDCATQWRVNDYNGEARGLDYVTVISIMRDVYGVPKKNMRPTLQQVKYVERGALGGMRGVPLDELIGDFYADRKSVV